MTTLNSLLFAVSLATFLPHAARADVEVAKYQGGIPGAFCAVPESGFHALTESRIREAEVPDGEKLEIVVRGGDGRVIFKTECGPGDAFDAPLGFVAKNSTIRVSAGEEARVALDFTVVRKDAMTVAAFQRDFQAQGFPTGWRYLWNQPTGYTTSDTGDLRSAEIGDPAQYCDLKWDKTNQTYSVDGDGDDSRTPSGALRLNSESGSPGFAYDEKNSPFQDRYVIASYEVGAAGFYAITDSWLKESDPKAGDSVEVLIHIDGHRPILRRFTRNPGETVTFDTDLAYLEPG